MFCVISPTNFY